MYQMNPVNDFYFRNAQAQNYGQQMLPFPPQQQFGYPSQPAVPPPSIRAVWVTNIEEAKASRSDDFLATNIFIDSSTGKIYMKRMDNDGRPQFLTYVIDEPEQKEEENPLLEINARLTNIENFLGGIANDKSVQGDAGTRQPVANAPAAATEQDEPDGKAESAGFSKNAGNDFWKKRR